MFKDPNEELRRHNRCGWHDNSNGDWLDRRHQGFWLLQVWVGWC